MKGRKEDWIGQVSRPRPDGRERKEGRKQDWAGKTQTVMQFYQSLGNPTGSSEAHEMRPALSRRGQAITTPGVCSVNSWSHLGRVALAQKLSRARRSYQLLVVR